MRVLIAEDDFTSQSILTAALKKNGHEVIAVSNGVEAWEALQQPDAPSLVILDWLMPEMDGIEVCRRIRALKTEEYIYIIMLTVKDEMRDVIAGLDAGADDYISKPYDPGELRARVDVGRRMLELHAKLAVQMRELQTAMENIKTLKGLVPICCHCKGIRDDKGYWNKIEKYILEHTDAELTHGICPDCMKKLYPDLHKD